MSRAAASPCGSQHAGAPQPAATGAQSAAPPQPVTCTAYVYLVACADGTLYAGWTTDVTKRVAAHNAGRGAKYTRSRLPVRLCYVQCCADKQEALRREWALKRLSRADKLALCARWRAQDGGERAGDGGSVQNNLPTV